MVLASIALFMLALSIFAGVSDAEPCMPPPLPGATPKSKAKGKNKWTKVGHSQYTPEASTEGELEELGSSSTMEVDADTEVQKSEPISKKQKKKANKAAARDGHRRQGHESTTAAARSTSGLHCC